MSSGQYSKIREIDAELDAMLRDTLRVGGKSVPPQSLNACLPVIQERLERIQSLLHKALKHSNREEYDSLVAIVEKWNSFVSFLGKTTIVNKFPNDRNIFPHKQNGHKQLLRGRVISVKMDKTAVAETLRIKDHSVTSKKITVRKKYKVHDPRNECQEGDDILFVECRPLSKTKHHRLFARLYKQLE